MYTISIICGTYGSVGTAGSSAGELTRQIVIVEGGFFFILSHGNRANERTHHADTSMSSCCVWPFPCAIRGAEDELGDSVRWIENDVWK